MGLHVVLYQPEIPQNTGNIMRTCVGVNAKLHLIEPLGFKLDEKTIKRSGVNYIEHLEYVKYPNWDSFLEQNKGKYVFFTRYGNKTPDQEDMTDSNEELYLIFGRESTGIPKQILRKYPNQLIRLPMTDKIRSLNLSNVVCTVLYEALRQRKYKGLYYEEPESMKGPNWIFEEE